MKKLLSILTAATLSITSTFTVISCDNKENYKNSEKVDLSIIDIDWALQPTNETTNNDVLKALKKIKGLENIQENIDVKFEISKSSELNDGFVKIIGVIGSKYVKENSIIVLKIEKIFNKPIPSGQGASAYATWEEANPNRKTKIIKKIDSNKKTYYSPYLDAGMYEGNNIAEMKHIDHLTLAFVQQVNEHNNNLELSIAGQAKNNDSYEWWQETQLWGKMLKPIVEEGNFKNVKVAYGGAATSGTPEKNPWSLARILNSNDLKKAQKDLTQAFIGYQQELVNVVQKYGGKSYNMPKSIDFDIEGESQNRNEDNILLAQTLASMKKEDKSWDFSVTLPVLPSGLTSVGYNVMNIFVQEYKAAGLTVSDLPVINLMLMDYGDNIYQQAIKNGKTNFDLAKEAINATAKNLNDSILDNYGQSTDISILYSLIGATPMIGVNDTVWGVFTDEDAKELYNWAQEKGLGYLSMWSVNDDRGKSIWGGKKVNKDLFSHGLWYLDEYDFGKIFAGDWTNIQK